MRETLEAKTRRIRKEAEEAIRSSQNARRKISLMQVGALLVHPEWADMPAEQSSGETEGQFARQPDGKKVI